VLGFAVVAAGVFGLVIGSFLNVVIYRVPKEESIVTPRSRCPGCSTVISARDNVPVLSWALLRGRCRHCDTPISARYPLVEALTGGLFAAVTARVGVEWELPAFLVVTAGLIALSFIDLDTYLLPKRVVYPVLGAGAVLFGAAALLGGDSRGAAEAAAGGATAFAVLLLIHLISPRGMGFGDVRLAAIVGMTLGWIEFPAVAVGLFLAFLLASAVGIGLMVARRRGRKDRVPFGPFLAAGAVLAIFVAQPILDIYLGRT
jgi:leader peptidase (prepilin peptidase)/N-methyltransferase